MNVLITSGGTQVPIDDIRSISNFSQGTFPTKLALEALNYDNVHFLYAKNTNAPHIIKTNLIEGFNINNALIERQRLVSRNYSFEEYTTYSAYAEKLYNRARWADVIISAAAVSDFAPLPQNGKISSENNVNITLLPLPKVIAGIKAVNPRCFLVGFKLLARHNEELMLEYAEKQSKMGVDLTIGNSYEELKAGKHTLRVIKNKEIVVVVANAKSLYASIRRCKNPTLPLTAGDYNELYNNTNCS